MKWITFCLACFVAQAAPAQDSSICSNSRKDPACLIGKTFWVKDPYRSGVGRFTKVRVENAAPDDINPDLTQLTIKLPSGESRIVDVATDNYSSTGLKYKFFRLDENFFDFDPKEKYKWPALVWKAIESGDVFIGMTREQVIMSWGAPLDINSTETADTYMSQYVYDRFGDRAYVYLRNGKVTAIQE